VELPTVDGQLDGQLSMRAGVRLLHRGSVLTSPTPSTTRPSTQRQSSFWSFPVHRARSRPRPVLGKPPVSGQSAAVDSQSPSGRHPWDPRRGRPFMRASRHPHNRREAQRRATVARTAGTGPPRARPVVVLGPCGPTAATNRPAEESRISELRHLEVHRRSARRRRRHLRRLPPQVPRPPVQAELHFHHLGGAMGRVTFGGNSDRGWPGSSADASGRLVVVRRRPLSGPRRRSRGQPAKIWLPVLDRAMALSHSVEGSRQR
jgi:hypothetical protein